MPYTDAFKSQMVKRMLGPPAMTATELSKQVGVTQPTLSMWLREARRVAAAMPDEKPVPAAPKKWTAQQKLRVVAAAHGLEDEALGALLRREGLHEGELRAWRDAAAGALEPGAEAAASGPLTAGQRRRLAASEKRVKELERELHRKEKALAEAGALLFLEKKLQAMGWDEGRRGGEDDAPDEPSEK
ncbi:hypothetical protein D7X96_19580 [Corallococcus interemptor]|uniref:Transposase n=1 Tax=Corallococcus interemptor TaxID=2316720 RepID=A0A3A8QFJ4_9BACT|nr:MULTISPECIES: transposase [Corallococcus]RKH67437.1 hypothetical protein D7X96_19580 [Corallococcus interemptor]